MPSFRYVAVTPDGRRVRGSIEGFSEPGVISDLLDRGLQRVRVRKRVGQLEITARKVKLGPLMHFSRQMAAFLRAGVPILDALAIVEEELPDKTLKTVVPAMADALRRGDSFSEAAAPYNKVFPPFYVAVLRSAEVTGNLDDVLDQLSKYIERDLDARRKIKSALAYPAVIMALSVVVVAVLVGFVLPRFEDFFASLDAELPLATRMLLGLTSFVSNFKFFIGGGILGLIIFIGVALSTQKGKAARDRLLLKIPVLSAVVRYSVIERFCRLLGAMVQAGIPLPQAMLVAAEGSQNHVYVQALFRVRQQMIQGEGLAGPIAATELFPKSATQMVRVGEETGTLDDQLDVTARFFEAELEYKLKNLTTLFEPMAILFMGFIVGFVAIALVSAIYGIYNQVELQ